MTIERFFILIEESGASVALRTAAGSAAVAAITYKIIQIDPLQLTFFVYPELLFAIMVYCFSWETTVVIDFLKFCDSKYWGEIMIFRQFLPLRNAGVLGMNRRNRQYIMGIIGGAASPLWMTSC